jgi:hypothetical protein
MSALGRETTVFAASLGPLLRRRATHGATGIARVRWPSLVVAPGIQHAASESAFQIHVVRVAPAAIAAGKTAGRGAPARSAGSVAVIPEFIIWRFTIFGPAQIRHGDFFRHLSAGVSLPIGTSRGHDYALPFVYLSPINKYTSLFSHVANNLNVTSIAEIFANHMPDI